jgi:hypothetical protein
MKITYPDNWQPKTAPNDWDVVFQPLDNSNAKLYYKITSGDYKEVVDKDKEHILSDQSNKLDRVILNEPGRYAFNFIKDNYGTIIPSHRAYDDVSGYKILISHYEADPMVYTQFHYDLSDFHVTVNVDEAENVPTMEEIEAQ